MHGVPLASVQAIMGHSSITVTVDMYGHVSGAHLADEMRRAMRGYGATISATNQAGEGTGR
jgi:integrase